MVMEVGESSNSGERRREKRPRKRKRTGEPISYETSVENLTREGKETLRIVNQKRRPLNTIPNTSSAVFDNTSPDYDWLRCGWIVEERLLSHGRLYRYYYDPIGQMHMTRMGVENICATIEKSRVIILD